MFEGMGGRSGPGSTHSTAPRVVHEKAVDVLEGRRERLKTHGESSLKRLSKSATTLRISSKLGTLPQNIGPSICL